MSAHNHQLSMDREFRYILQWFAEWSEIQREDFVPVLLESLMLCGSGDDPSAIALLPAVNGVLAPGLAAASLADKPMSLFQCRVSEYGVSVWIIVAAQSSNNTSDTRAGQTLS